MNLLKQIKDWFIVADNKLSDENKKIVIDALAHYCPLCKQGFRTKGGKTNHNRLKHAKNTITHKELR